MTSRRDNSTSIVSGSRVGLRKAAGRVPGGHDPTPGYSISTSAKGQWCTPKGPGVREVSTSARVSPSGGYQSPELKHEEFDCGSRRFGSLGSNQTPVAGPLQTWAWAASI
ncbi:MAG: hypothetical protein AMXMBFR13_23060 [Phycisphaerae bacterium]